MKKKAKTIVLKSLLGCLTLSLIVSTVVLTSCSDDGGTPPPVASFTHEADTEDGLKITFTSTSENATAYAWDFGVQGTNDDVSSEQNPVYTYADPGDYTVSLTVQGEDGSVDTESKTIQVERVIGQGEAVASFSMSTDGLTVTFTNNSEEAISYEWDFNADSTYTDNSDLSTSSDATVVYTYDTVGWYKITLKATGIVASDERTDSVYVDVFGIKNGQVDEETSKDANTAVWRNRTLEDDGDTNQTFIDQINTYRDPKPDPPVTSSDFFVKASSNRNHTDSTVLGYGAWALNLTSHNTSTKPKRWIYQTLAVNQNTDYTLKFWVQVEANTNQLITCQIYDGPFDDTERIDDASHIIAEEEFSGTSIETTHVDGQPYEWKEVTFKFNSGAYWQVVLFIDNDWINSTDQFWLDDFVLTKD